MRIEVPDLMNGAEVKKLREWDGDYNGIHRIKTIRVFPPIAGMSLPDPAVTPSTSASADINPDETNNNNNTNECDTLDNNNNMNNTDNGLLPSTTVNSDVISATVAMGETEAGGIQMMMMMEGEGAALGGETDDC